MSGNPISYYDVEGLHSSELDNPGFQPDVWAMITVGYDLWESSGSEEATYSGDYLMQVAGVGEGSTTMHSINIPIGLKRWHSPAGASFATRANRYVLKKRTSATRFFEYNFIDLSKKINNCNRKAVEYE